MLGWRLCYGSSTSYLMTWLWIPHASMSTLGCFGRFTLFSPRVSHSNTCRLLSFVCFVFLFGFFVFVVFWFLFCKCLGIPNSPRSLDLDDRQGLIARSAMQQKKKKNGADRLGQTLDIQYLVTVPDGLYEAISCQGGGLFKLRGLKIVFKVNAGWLWGTG